MSDAVFLLLGLMVGFLLGHYGWGDEDGDD